MAKTRILADEVEINGVTYAWPSEYPPSACVLGVDVAGRLSYSLMELRHLSLVVETNAGVGKPSATNGILVSKFHVPGFLKADGNGDLQFRFFIYQVMTSRAITFALYKLDLTRITPVTTIDLPRPPFPSGEVGATVNVGTDFVLTPGQYYVAVTWSGTDGSILGYVRQQDFIVRGSYLIPTGGGSSLPNTLSLSGAIAGNWMIACEIYR